jgi:SnoaL-like domain
MGTPLEGDREQLVRRMYAAFALGDRAFYEEHLAEDFTFSAPPDPLLDRAGWFERCWPGAGRGQHFEIVRLIEAGDEVVVTYETETSSSRRGRNTEVITFAGSKIVRVEVYFGWALEG